MLNIKEKLTAHQPSVKLLKIDSSNGSINKKLRTWWH